MFNIGMTQMEMADALNVDQSTIRRDIGGLSLQARDEYAKRIFQERRLELQRMTAKHDGTMKRVWELVDDKNLTIRERMAALSLLLKCYKVKGYLIPSRRDDVKRKKGLEAAVQEGND